jgi:hypothetical protein
MGQMPEHHDKIIIYFLVLGKIMLILYAVL